MTPASPERQFIKPIIRYHPVIRQWGCSGLTFVGWGLSPVNAYLDWLGNSGKPIKITDYNAVPYHCYCSFCNNDYFWSGIFGSGI